MKISPQRIDAFVRQPPADLTVALVFGPDAGAVRQRAEQIAKHIVPTPDDPFRVSLLESDAIAAEPGLLRDAMLEMALGGGRRLVRVKQAEEKIAAAVSALLQDKPDSDTLLLLEAGELDKRSKLRTLSEGENSTIAALACYPEEGEEREKLIRQQLRVLGCSIGDAALEELAMLTPPDRIGLFSELDKLTLYAGDAKEISPEDVRAALGDAAGVDMDSMVMAAGDGDQAALDAALRRLQAEATAPVALLRAAQRHFNRLLETRARVDGGMGVKDAMQKLQPRVFWKVETAFAKQVQRWPYARLLRALALLVETEALCKRTGIPDVTLCQQTMVTLARGAG
ncbi:MAG: DNA polymerase III subunit delta [Alphaproteobacteria bacterium]|nr:DNA polymerase III subunit delta [Alphaproteobacteria bacterium]